MIKSLLSNTWFRVSMSAVAALLAYGLWAYWINLDHGASVAMKAGLVQGAYSFSLTFFLSLLIEYLFQCWSHWRFGVPLVAMVVCGLLYSFSWGINVLAMTPEILWTILPGATMSTLFTISYLIALKLSQENTGD